jgi:hypothetical protein
VSADRRGPALPPPRNGTPLLPIHGRSPPK